VTGSDDPAVRRAEEDFVTAIRLLEPLAADGVNAEAAQGLGRARNNLGNLLSSVGRPGDARGHYDAAIALHERLVKRYPENREYKLELAQLSNNLAYLLLDQRALELADRRSERARILLEDLARPAPSLDVERADNHTLRAQILQGRGSREAIVAYRDALDQFAALSRTTDAAQFLPFHQRFSDLIRALSVPGQPRAVADAGLLADAIGEYVSVGERAHAAGQTQTVDIVLGRVLKLLPPALAQMSREDRQTLTERVDALQKKAGGKSPAGRFD